MTTNLTTTTTTTTSITTIEAIATNDSQSTAATTDNQLIQSWLAQKSKSTQKTYGYCLNDFFSFLGYSGEGQLLRSLKIELLLAYDQHLENKGLKGNTRKSKISILKSLLSYGTKLGYLNRNIGQLFSKKINNHDKSTKSYYDQKELEARLHKPCSSLRDKLFVGLMAISGMRISEVCSLKWSDINCVNGSYFLSIYGKGFKHRNISLPSNFKDFYAQLLELRINGNEFIFVGKHGRSHLSRKTGHLIIKKVLGSNFKSHNLRHLHALYLYQSSHDLELIRKRLGHSSLSTTQTYLEALPEDNSQLEIFASMI